MNLSEIRRLVGRGQYSVRWDAVLHALKEGFTETDIVEAVLYGRELERYPDDYRCLVCGQAQLDFETKAYLHVVCDYFDPERIDFVTAYIPQKPWWSTPWTRVRRQR